MRQLRVVGGLIVSVAICSSGAAAEETFQKLTGAQIRGRIAGMEVSDEVHWRDFYDRTGRVTSSSMGHKRTGKWRIEKDQLCVEFEQEMPNCYEVLVWGKKARLQREGALPLEVIIEPPSGGL
jgi:hypothetical protein